MGYTLDRSLVYCRATQRDSQPSTLTLNTYQSDQRACLSECGRKLGYLERSHTVREANS